MSDSPLPAATAQKPFWATVRRGCLGKCPACGEGKLFRSYLKPVDACAHCDEPLGHIRADDGPAWLTIVLVTHIIAPLMLLLPGFDTPLWLVVILAIIPTTALMLLLLPRSKGLFISMIWRSGCVGSEG